MRPFTVIGEGQRDDMAVSLWLDAAIRGEPVDVLGSLSRARDVTDVRKVVAGLARIAELRSTGVLNLGAGRPRALGEILEAVFTAVGRETPVLVRPAPAQEAAVTFADTSRSAALGIDLETDLEVTVARQLAARRSRGRRRVAV